MPTVFIPTAYRGPTSGVSEVAVTAGTVRECLQAVEDQYPGFAPLVFDGSGALQRFVKLFVNEVQLDADSLDQEIATSDRLEVLAAIAGG
jgi:molybdopterin converting factor small subunit